MELKILDTTLREGEQTPGVFFNIDERIEIAKLLDEIGVDIIEAGHTAANQTVYNSIKKIIDLNLNSKISAHSRANIKDIDLSLDLDIDSLGIFYCVSNSRLKKVFNKTLDEAIEIITNSIRHIKSKKNDLNLRFTPEDTGRTEFGNVIKVSTAAAEAGADIISIADTTGFFTPDKTFEYIKRLKEELNNNNVNLQIEVHFHNDLGLALANSVSSLEAGASIFDTSILGLGERAGITDLSQLLAILNFKYNIKKYKLENLFKTYKKVSEIAQIPIQKNFPLMGEYSFTHCAGVHTHAIAKDNKQYEEINPSIFLRKSEICLDQMSGISSVKMRLDKLNLNYTQEQAREILNIIKNQTNKSTISDQELKEIYTKISSQ